ncbi:RDD family protein [Amylibacter sp. SFDW26]|uniref:RDD family protein n=1 Tax=Amylibacter sp. SFDW26 TaxID=2652722 RepID=UPI001261CF54|nr:RDD family protein [Amylibacter sp. SFDW26]KAB7615574.1 RDD family protein [Amylibacter sp. SFDW26]
MFSTNHDLSQLPDPIADAQFYAAVPFKRLLAWIIDTIIIIALAAATVMATFFIGAFFFPVILFFVNVAYRIFTLSRSSATFGMKLAGIEIRNKNGNKLSLEEAAWHTGIYTALTIIPILLAISIVMMFINERGQALHDYVLGTTAINRPNLP